MERKKNIIDKYSIPFLYIMYSVGIAGHLIPVTNELMIALTPFTLLLTGGVVIYNVIRRDKRIIYWIIITYLLTYALEVIGVKTGMIFGDYSYGDVFGLNIFETPLIIGFNWVLVVLGASLISLKITGNIIVASLITGLLAVIFDFMLEPVAVTFNYWTWSGGAIPIMNYFAWFVIAFCFSLLYSFMKIKIDGKAAVHYFIVQLLFFISLNIFL